jgi:4-amino-4-deoxy-L-arabinose transferase-like glycosyltransferase
MTVSSRTPTRPSLRLVWWLLVAAVAWLWFGTLGMRHLLSSDEGRYAQIAYEMFASGDWVTPRYHGLKYFEKPPFHLWMTALAYSAFGAGEWQARLWVACSGAIGIAATAWAACRWFGPRAGAFAGLALLAAPTWNIGSHFNALDMGVSAALACVLAALLIAQHPSATGQQRQRWMWAAWAAMAVAVLTKGLIGIVLPGLALVAYTLLARHWALWTRLHLVSGTLIFLAIAAPWFVLVSLRNPEFPQFYFIHEHWDRYTSTVHNRSAPAWYFVPQWLAGFLPWLMLLPRMARELLQEAKTGFRPLLLCAMWALMIFAFFSASGSKLPGYILPLFPALAIWAGVALQALNARTWSRPVTWMLVLAAAAVTALVASQVLGHGPSNPLTLQYLWWVAAAGALAVLGLVISFLLNKRGALWGSITAYALAFFVATTVGVLGHNVLGRPASGADLVATIQQELKPGMTIYAVRRLDHTLPFYLRRITVMVEEPDELAFGVRQEPQKWLPTLAAFEAAWTSGAPALAIMSPATFTTLRPRPWTMRVVAQDNRRVVVANFPKATP